MKILFLPKYSYSGASSRYRTHQFIPFFRKEGIICDVKSFFDDEHINTINKSMRGLSLRLLFFILRRIKILLKVKKYDLLFIEKEIIPYFPPIIEFILQLFGVKYILDYDDAIFHNYNKTKNIFIRIFLKNKINSIIKKASYIIVGNTYLENYALKFNKRVAKIPTVIDLNKYKLDTEIKKNEGFIIGWVGSYYSSKYFVSIIEALQLFEKKYKCEIRLIGFNKNLLTKDIKLPINVIKWNKYSEIKEIQKFTVGIAPLLDSPFARGKCAFKSVQYMACKLPVITTPIGANGEIIKHNINGFYANTKEEWFKYIEYLYQNPDVVNEFGERNRKLIEKEYSVQSKLKQYIEIFNFIYNKL